MARRRSRRIASRANDLDLGELDRRGYLLVEQALDDQVLQEVRRVVDETEAAGASASNGSAREKGTRHVDLDIDEPRLRPIVANGTILEAVRHTIGERFVMTQLHAREPRPGFGRQGLHVDWLARARADAPFVGVTVLWLVDPFEHDGEAGNGATRIVPGSHLQARAVPKACQDPRTRHPDEAWIEGPSGSALVFNAHTWHAGSVNTTGKPRLAIQQLFVREDVAGQYVR